MGATPASSRSAKNTFALAHATAPLPTNANVHRAFAQRRDQIIGDNLQLRTDVDVYNDLNHGKRPPIQLVLDYTDDVAERQEFQKMRPKRAEVA